MSVVGFDIGSSNAVVAAAGRGAINIIRNELSDRQTSVLLGFTDEERLIGEAAVPKLKSNWKNSCRSFRNLLGCLTTDDLSMESPYLLAPLAETTNCQLGYKVRYKGEERVVSVTQVMGAFLSKLKEISELSTGQVARDVVIGVPGWFTNINRQAMLDAAAIANINCLKLMNEETAVALDYGIYRSAVFSESESLFVAFVNCGCSSSWVSIVEFKKGILKVKATNYDRTVSGRAMDNAILDYVASDFNKNHNCNILNDPKARLKLEDAAVKCKKILSANQEAPFGVECLMDDYDVSLLIKRTQFEEMASPMTEKLTELILRTVEDSKLTLEQISSVELIGGASRVPWVQQVISQAFGGKDLSKTLNADEAVARGCALQAAILSPIFKVRDFNVVDLNNFDIQICWASDDKKPVTDLSTLKSAVLYSAGCDFNLSKSTTFTKAAAFDIWLRYDHNNRKFPKSVLPNLGQYSIQLAERQQEAKVKLYVSLSLSGIVKVEKAELCEEEIIEETVEEEVPVTPNGEQEPEVKEPEKSEDTNMEGDQECSGDGVNKNAATPVAPKTKKVLTKKEKVRVKRINIPIVHHPLVGYLSYEELSALKDIENKMSADDNELKLTRESLNELESYILTMRQKLQKTFAPFAEKDALSSIAQQLDSTEQWVYDNFNATRAEFCDRLELLKNEIIPIERRLTEYNLREELYNKFYGMVNEAKNVCTNAQSLFEEEGKQLVIQKAGEVENWINGVVQEWKSTPLHVDVKTTSNVVINKMNEFESYCKSTLKQIVQEEKKPENSSENQDTMETSDETDDKKMDVENEKNCA